MGNLCHGNRSFSMFFAGTVLGEGNKKDPRPRTCVLWDKGRRPLRYHPD
ncbi:hypothetical protein BACCAP_03550 [Pseudoflavonifractor capillosus ATCC 29799]|uniref:Uncharacterized protein n=1 Tax=Pseudoflavonifractor capillosus ATCC 29799 TaxID=411467 RepID=A6NZ98_9FIRM|nr:hypothetical protein BACCAP_03550 [Pseudoflavonifractor capillosus ATCC 29799]